MKVIKTGVESVDDLYGIEFTGNMIPHSWYAAIQTENGRPDLAAIVILAEILYWHRPTVERTADDAAVIVLKKKFHADLLQMSYAQIEITFPGYDPCKKFPTRVSAETDKLVCQNR